MTTPPDSDAHHRLSVADGHERDPLLCLFAENAPVMLAYYDAQLRCVFCNDQYAVATGWNTESIVGRTAQEIFGAEWANVAPYFEKVLEGNRMHYELPWTIATGDERYIEANIVPRLDDRGTLIGVLALLNDITDYRRAEEALQESDIELAKRATELARSNADLEQLAYIASHDLQEPLRMVTSYLTLLETRYKDKIDKNANEFIDFAVDGAKRMHGLIEDLLTYSRVGTRAKPHVPTDCSQVVDIALKNLSVAIKEKGATVTRDALPTVMADATQLTQVFQNLVGNALKFHGAQPTQVRIEVQPDGDHWRFAVRDNGIGIASEHFERIFVLFKRLHTRQQYPGTGLGLAICKKIVEGHGGKIWVESLPGAGACFYFTLPTLESVVAAAGLKPDPGK